MSGSTRPRHRDPLLPPFAKQLLLEHFASDSRLLEFHSEWHEFAEAHDRWFALVLTHGRRSSSEVAPETTEYVNSLHDLLEEIRLDGEWCAKAVHELIVGPLVRGSLVPFVTAVFADKPIFVSASPMFTTLAEARNSVVAQLKAEWDRRGLPERPSRSTALTRNVCWLYWRLSGRSSSEIVIKHLGESDEAIDEAAVRQAITQAASLAEVTLPRGDH